MPLLRYLSCYDDRLIGIRDLTENRVHLMFVGNCVDFLRLMGNRARNRKIMNAVKAFDCDYEHRSLITSTIQGNHEGNLPTIVCYTPEDESLPKIEE